MSIAPRILGILTAGYGTAVVVRPEVLAVPCELTDDSGVISAATLPLIRAVGARDMISGVAMLVAPRPNALRAAVAIRITSDITDAIGFGLGLPTTRARTKAAVVATAWGALCAASASRIS